MIASVSPAVLPQLQPAAADRRRQAPQLPVRPRRDRRQAAAAPRRRPTTRPSRSCPPRACGPSGRGTRSTPRGSSEPDRTMHAIGGWIAEWSGFPPPRTPQSKYGLPTPPWPAMICRLFAAAAVLLGGTAARHPFPRLGSEAGAFPEVTPVQAPALAFVALDDRLPRLSSPRRLCSGLAVYRYRVGTRSDECQRFVDRRWGTTTRTSGSRRPGPPKRHSATIPSVPTRGSCCTRDSRNGARATPAEPSRRRRSCIPALHTANKC